MRRLASTFLLASVLSGPISLTAAPLKSSYILTDHGQRREFIIATDEVHTGRTTKRVAGKANVEEIRQAAGAAGGDLVVYQRGLPRTVWNRRLVTKDLSVQVAAGTDADTVAAEAGLLNLGAAPNSPGYVLFRAMGGAGSALEAADRLRRRAGVLSVEPLLARQQSKRLFFDDQWNLLNDGQGGGTPGIDLNVFDVWNVNSITGQGITIGIVDDGIQRDHPDLVGNYSASLSYDFNYDDTDPLPPPFDGDDHGTACASLAAGSGLNGNGIFGVAYQAKLAALRLISLPDTDAQEAAAFAWHNGEIQVKSNSWGPPDTGNLIEAPGPLGRAALEEAVQTGRGGLGTIFVWAAGNGGTVGDSASFDGYASGRQVIAVGAVTNKGVKANYSEAGASVLVVAPSSGGTLDIPSADRPDTDGYNYNGFRDYADLDYTKTFGGTSAAAPQVAGVAALVLKARPTIGWRDLKEILLSTATKIDDVTASGWITNGAGFHFSDKYGAGLVNAKAAVDLAQTHANLPPEVSTAQEQSALATVIPDFNPRAPTNGLERTFVFSQQHLRVEQVALTVDVQHALRGQLEITLTSPMGTVTKMAPVRPRDRLANLVNVTFTTPHFWGETADGTWKVKVSDKIRGSVGVLQRVKLELFGSVTAGQGRLVENGYTVSADADSDGDVDPNETVTVNFSLKNEGATSLTNVTATLLEATGVTNPSGPVGVGTIPGGGTGSVNFTFTSLGTLGSTAYATLALQSNGVDIGTVIYPIVLGTVSTATFRSDRAIEIPPYPRTAGNAAPYPAPLTVSNLPPNAVITNVALQMDHLGHTSSADLDMLLVSPQGGKMIPMSDVGDYTADDISVTLDDDAVAPMPENSPLFGGRYRPSNYGAAVDVFPGAPARPYGSNFAVFKGQNPDGIWKLYIRDDAARDRGGLGSWSLIITYAH